MQLKKFIEQTNGDPKKSFYDRIAMAESGGKNNAVNPTKGATASGKYQFIESTWKEMVDKHNLGYSLNDRFNPEKSQKVMELFTKENENYLTKKLGRSLNDADLYSAHFLGAGGAEKFLKTVNKNPNKLATEHFSGKVLSDNKSVMYNKDGSPRTVEGVYAELGRRMGDTSSPEVVQEETPQQKELTDLMFTNYLPNIAGIDLGTSEEETADDKVVKETEKELQKEDRKLNAFDNYKQQQEQLAQLAPQQQSQEDTFSAIQTFQGVDQFVSQPLMQRGGKTPIYVTDKNDPRYRAYQDSLTLNNNSIKALAKMNDNSVTGEEFTKFGETIYPATLKAYTNLNKPKPIESRSKIKPHSSSDSKESAVYVSVFKKPTQPVILEEQRPKVQGLKVSITPAGIESQNQSLQGEELPQRTYAQIPTSYDVNSQRYNIQGENPYYDYNAENTDYETALRAKLSAENYNADIERRYGNEEALKNPKATERLNQLRQDVTITPNYQNGGETEYETAMRGMMKLRIGLGNAFGNSAIKRMSQATPKTGETPEGTGTHYMGSVDNYAVPQLQDVGAQNLRYYDDINDALINGNEKIEFRRPEDAIYFAEHYKEVAPMSTTYKDVNNYQNGGETDNLEQLRNKFRETLKLQKGGKIPVSPNGLYDYPNQTVRVPTDGSITMKKISYPVLGTSDQTGEQKVMLPGMEYFFSKTNTVTERPLKK